MVYTISNEYLTVSAETSGAELKSVKTKDDNEYLWQGSLKYWNHRAINIFPFCGRLFDQKYTYKGKEYTIGNHGFARSSEFVLESISDNKMTFLLTSNQDTLPSYPFEFELRISYELNGNTLSCTNNVINTGNENMLFATGGHPGFNVPLEKGLSFDDYKIYLGNENLERMGLTNKGLRDGAFTPYKVTDGIIHLTHSVFDEDVFVKYNFDYAKLYSDKSERSVTVKSSQANFLGLWHANKTDAPYVCIEPWQGCPSLENGSRALEDKDYMINLEPGKKYSYCYTITIE